MLSVTAFFTQDGGAPATGLALADVALYLTAIAKANGAATVIWDGTQHPSAEVAGLGLYLRQYSGEDTALYDYVGGAQYTGASELDANWTTGVMTAPVKTDSAGRVEISSATDKNTLDSVVTALQGADGDTLKTLSDQIDGVGTGITAQAVRDAMKLAPSAGAAADGSIDDLLTDMPAAIAAISAGAGSGTGTYTDTVTDGTNPLDGVIVELSTDNAKANVAYQTRTNASGVFLFHPDPGTYYVWFELAGHNFDAENGAEVVVV